MSRHPWVIVVGGRSGHAAHIPSGFSLAGYSAAVLIASVHFGRHEWEVTSVVKPHVAELGKYRPCFSL